LPSEFSPLCVYHPVNHCPCLTQDSVYLYMVERILFDEKQYLGYNKYSIVRRTIFAIFCFVLYYWSENPKPVSVGSLNIGPYPVHQIERSGQLFFLMGLAILLLSILLIFVLHLHTRVGPGGITLSGFWRSRKVYIPLEEVASAKKVRFKETIVNHPSYHHYFKGKIRFYSRGNEAVELTRKDGLIYRIGSQKANELLKAIREAMKKNVETKFETSAH
jgi:hypothetical protein